MTYRAFSPDYPHERHILLRPLPKSIGTKYPSTHPTLSGEEYSSSYLTTPEHKVQSRPAYAALNKEVAIL